VTRPATTPIIAEPPSFDDPRYRDDLRAFCRDASRWMRDIHEDLTRVERPVEGRYTVSNPSTNRSLDVSAADLATLRAVVGTIIADLVTKRLFRTKG
jgi:hypothetical protein